MRLLNSNIIRNPGRYYIGLSITISIFIIGLSVIIIWSISLLDRFNQVRTIKDSEKVIGELDNKYREIFKEINTLKSSVNKYNSILDAASTLQSKINEIITLSDKNGLKTINTKQGESELSEGIVETRVSLQVAGTYKDIVRFMEDLENSYLPIWFTSIDMKTEDAVDSKIICDMNCILADWENDGR